jgi:hypothetical protein
MKNKCANFPRQRPKRTPAAQANAQGDADETWSVETPLKLIQKDKYSLSYAKKEEWKGTAKVGGPV